MEPMKRYRKDSEHMIYYHGLVVNYKMIKPSILNV